MQSLRDHQPSEECDEPSGTRRVAVRAGIARILIAENDRQALRELARILRNAGFEVEVAGSYQEVLRMIECSSFDAVVADLSPSEMSAVRILAAVRERDRDRRLPVVMISGNSEMRGVLEELKDPALHLLAEPLGDRVLPDLLRRLLPVRCSVLLADDDPYVQRAVGRAAAQHGCELIQVTKSAAVHSTAIERRPDLIVLDITFPDADGRDLLAELKADERTRDIPVLVWSGRYDPESARQLAISLGAEDYVEKASAELLICKIERMLWRISGG